MADNIAALGMITRTRRQVRLADGRCGGINAQLELEVKFGNKQVTKTLLILSGVVDPLVLGCNFLKQVGTEIRCAGHEIIIPARNRNNGWLEERLSVAVVQQQRVRRYYSVPGSRAGRFQHKHQIKMKDDKPIKNRFYPKNPNGVHRAFKEPIQPQYRDGEKEDRQVKTVCRLQTDQREVSECLHYILDQLR